MINEYIINGEIARDKIAMDIKYRKITRDTIEKLCADPRIKVAFIGSSFQDKRPKQEWNKEYLGRLSYVVVGESFNRDYLLYLDEVAKYVSKATFKKIIVAGVIIVLVIIAGVIMYKYVLGSTATKASATDINSLTVESKATQRTALIIGGTI